MTRLLFSVMTLPQFSRRVAQFGFLALLLLNVVNLTSLKAQTIRYVTTSGNNPDPATATTWATSTTNLQGAINASASGDKVWVAAGTYKPGGAGNTNRNLSFSMKNGVAIYGGFAGGEMNLTDRPNVNPVTGQPNVARPSSSTLSGEIGAVDSFYDNIGIVIANTDLNNTAELDGFVITSAYNQSTTLGGGGMYNLRSSPLLRNLLVVNNEADNNGGGMYNNSSSNPTLTYCVFRGNEAGQNGAGMANVNSNPTLTNCSFLTNFSSASDYRGSTGGGGGMYNMNSSPQITDCLFKGNEVPEGDGGGIFNTNTSNPVLTNCVFDSNFVLLRGGGLVNLSNSSPRLSNCSFLNNVGGEGGGIANESGSPILTDCMFDGNRTGDFGGGMYTIGGAPSLTNCVFKNNQAIETNPDYGYGGGGLFISNFYQSRIEVGLVRVTNCAFLNNSAIFGGGVANTYQAILTNCTFQSNSAISGGTSTRGSETPGSGGGIYTVGNSLTLVGCSFQSNQAAIIGGGLYAGGFNGMATNCSFQSNSAPTGGGMYNSGSSPILTNCSFQSNSATTGRAIYNINKSSSSLTNCILFGNGGQNTIVNGLNQGSNADDSNLTASYSLFESGETDYTGPNNLTATVSPFASTTATQLAPCSVAIDAGDPASTTATSGTTDLAGNPRFYLGGRIDMGAYERQSIRTVGITQQPASGTTVNVGSTVSIAVSTTGTVTTYQWLKNGVALTGVASATTATLTLNNVQPSDAGSYRLAVTGICNSLTSTAFSLTVVYFIRYVRQGASGDGTSWATASGDLQSQINANGVQQVWVAAGTYKPGPVGNTNRNISFGLKNGVLIYGGFPSSGTPALTDRNPQSFSTILSGDIGTVGNPTDNSQAVVASSGLDNTAELDGFVITQGYTTTNAGGGLYNSSSSPILRNLLITGNTAVNGGGMANLSTSNPRLVNCVISNNSASSNGGGMFNQIASPTLVNCLISGNSATSAGGGLLNTASSNPQLVNCTLSTNTGGSGRGLANAGNSRASLLNCIVWNNGGAMTFSSPNNTTLTATYCLFDASVTGYPSSPTNLTTTTSPFGSDSDLRLNSCSPAINAGDPATTTATVGNTDLAGNPRFYNGSPGTSAVVDMGAYEFQGNPVSMYTVKAGSWSDTSVWSCGRVPVSTDAVTLNHAVSLPDSYVGQALRVIYSLQGQGRLLFGTSSRLRLAGI